MYTIPKEHIAVAEELSEQVETFLKNGGVIHTVTPGKSVFNSNSKTSSWKSLPEFGKTK